MTDKDRREMEDKFRRELFRYVGSLVDVCVGGGGRMDASAVDCLHAPTDFDRRTPQMLVLAYTNRWEAEYPEKWQELMDMCDAAAARKVRD